MRSASAWSLSLLVLVITSLGPAGVRAQDATEAERAFLDGAVAADEGRWADSEAAFRRAYALSGATSALFNVGVALRALGRHRAARDAFLEALRAPALSPEMRERVERFASESAARVGSLSLEGLAPDQRYSVQLDAEVLVDGGVRPWLLESEGGTHILRVSLAGFLPFEWRGDLTPGVTRSLTVVLEPLPSSGTDLAREPWLWITIGVLVLGGVAVATAVAYEDAQLDTSSPVRFNVP